MIDSSDLDLASRTKKKEKKNILVFFNKYSGKGMSSRKALKIYITNGHYIKHIMKW